MKAGKLGWALCACVSLFGCGGSDDSVGEAVPVAELREEIINGSPVTTAQNPGVVALYHQELCESANPNCSPVGSFFWFFRPCSAVTLRSQTNDVWILTARHCVTTNGASNGSLVLPSQLRVNVGLSPGVVAPGGSPPAGSIQPVQIVATASVPTGSGFDAALVKLNTGLPLVTPRVVLPMNSPTSLTSEGFASSLRAFGYGRFVEGGDTYVEDGSSGAGTLRATSLLTFDQACPTCGAYGTVTLLNNNAAGQGVWRGDSGGPTFVQHSGFYRLVGVHSTATLGIGSKAKDASVHGMFNWIRTNLRFLYLSPGSHPTLDLGVEGAVAEGARVRVGVAPRGWVWTNNGSRIQLFGTAFYLTAEANAQGEFNVVLRSNPTSAAHANFIYSQGRLSSTKPVLCSQCLHAKPDGSLTLDCCSLGWNPIGNQLWAFHGNP